MTTSELARRCRLTQAQVSRLEHGLQGFRSASLERIAAALGVQPVYFYIEDDDRESPPYGLLASEKIRRALAEPAFRKYLEDLARAYAHDRDAFDVVARVAAVILRH